MKYCNFATFNKIVDRKNLDLCFQRRTVDQQTQIKYPKSYNAVNTNYYTSGHCSEGQYYHLIANNINKVTNVTHKNNQTILNQFNLQKHLLGLWKGSGYFAGPGKIAPRGYFAGPVQIRQKSM